MGNRKEKQKITLEALLEIKRHERPGEEFWDSFENDFQRRRLNSLCIQPSLRESFLTPAWKALVFGAPALMLMGLAVFWTRMDTSMQREADATETAPQIKVEQLAQSQSDSRDRADVLPAVATDFASSQFVLDAIQDDAGPSMNFRKVLYTPAIHLSVPSGSFYVRDNFSSSNYQVTTADLKLGRNF